ncbi:MAG: 2-dehydro-3-deoxyphosphooctonate aldolase [Bacteroidota bacterium]
MKAYILFLVMIPVLISCTGNRMVSSKGNTAKRAKLLDQNTFVISEISSDPRYGFTKKNPIMVGGIKKSEGPLNQRRYLNALSGPNGEPISYYRYSSCCPFKTKNGLMGQGMLDEYRVTWGGSTDTVSVYINMYDFGELKAPLGFDIKAVGD